MLRELGSTFSLNSLNLYILHEFLCLSNFNVTKTGRQDILVNKDVISIQDLFCLENLLSKIEVQKNWAGIKNKRITQFG